jgi:hypothetical protein
MPNQDGKNAECVSKKPLFTFLPKCGLYKILSYYNTNTTYIMRFATFLATLSQYHFSF